MIKKLIPITEYGLQFTEDEMTELGFEPGQRFTVKPQDDGTILFEPFTKIEIELEDFTREELVNLVALSCEKDVSVNEIIREKLTEAIYWAEKEKGNNESTTY